MIRPWGLLSLPPTPPRAGGRTRSGSAKTGENDQRQPRLVYVCRCKKQAAAKVRFQGKMLQADGVYAQICSFTACGGGVSVVSLIGSVGFCEAASQCGCGKGSVLPIGSVLSKSQEIGCVCEWCVCARDVVKPTEKLVSVAQQRCGGDAWEYIIAVLIYDSHAPKQAAYIPFPCQANCAS